MTEMLVAFTNCYICFTKTPPLEEKVKEPEKYMTRLKAPREDEEYIDRPPQQQPSRWDTGGGTTAK